MERQAERESLHGLTWDPEPGLQAGEVEVTALRWIYQRIGQMTCFGLGTGFALGVKDGELPYAVCALGFLLTGLGLKALHVWQANMKLR